MTKRSRAWIYRVTLAVGPLAIFYGLVTDAEFALWLAVISALLGSGTATVYTHPSGGKRATKRNTIFVGDKRRSVDLVNSAANQQLPTAIDERVDQWKRILKLKKQ